MDFNETNGELLDELYYRARRSGPHAEMGNAARMTEVYNELRFRHLTVREHHRMLSIWDEFPASFQ